MDSTDTDKTSGRAARVRIAQLGPEHRAEVVRLLSAAERTWSSVSVNTGLAGLDGLVLYDGPYLSGVVLCEERDRFIRVVLVVVGRECRRRGFARRLLDEVARCARDLDKTHLTAILPMGDRRALKLFRSSGFTFPGRYPVHVPIVDTSADDGIDYGLLLVKMFSDRPQTHRLAA